MTLQPIKQNETIFSFQDTDIPIRFMRDPNGDLWIVVTDLGNVLKLTNIRKNITDIPVERKVTLPVTLSYTNNNINSNRSLTLIHEDEAIKLVMRVRSKDRLILKFQNWVT